LLKNKNNVIYNTCEGQKVFQKKIFTPFNTALIKAENLGINNSIKNINLSSNENLCGILIRMEEFN
jgi:hypothetical protein